MFGQNSYNINKMVRFAELRSIWWLFGVCLAGWPSAGKCQNWMASLLLPADYDLNRPPTQGNSEFERWIIHIVNTTFHRLLRRASRCWHNHECSLFHTWPSTNGEFIFRFAPSLLQTHNLASQREHDFVHWMAWFPHPTFGQHHSNSGRHESHRSPVHHRQVVRVLQLLAAHHSVP